MGTSQSKQQGTSPAPINLMQGCSWARKSSAISEPAEAPRADTTHTEQDTASRGARTCWEFGSESEPIATYESEAWHLTDDNFIPMQRTLPQSYCAAWNSNCSQLAAGHGS